MYRVVCDPDGYTPEGAYVRTLHEARQIADWSDVHHDRARCRKHSIETAVWVSVLREIAP